MTKHNQTRSVTVAGGFSRVVTLVLLTVVLVGLAWVNLHRQQAIDWWKLRGYTPPDEIAHLASLDTMNDQARRVFYVNHPAIADKSDFNSHCPNNGGEQTIVLGCYRSGQNGIYLLKVSDARLQGVQQVTAAHEMLHAAYDRLSDWEREELDGQLQEFYKNGLTDKRIQKTIAAYQKSEPDDVVNEMHSIFGTEVVTLPSELEQYYKKYFNDRSAIVAAANQYQSEFTSRQETVDRYDAVLADLKADIDNGESELKQTQQNIERQRQDLMDLRNSDTAAYNSQVPEYNSAVSNYNARVRRLQQQVSRYNALVAERNAVALEADKLVNELSSSTPALQQ